MRGAALKFETKNFHGVTPLFLDQKAQTRDKKKFGYKSRNMKFPLRSNYVSSAAVAPNEDQRKFQQNKKSNLNKKDSGITQKATRSSDQQLPATKQKKKEMPPSAKQKNHPFAETVTLTKAQFNAILASVGKLQDADKIPDNDNGIAKFDEQKEEEKEVVDFTSDHPVPNQDVNQKVEHTESLTKDIYEETPKNDIFPFSGESEKDALADLQFHGQKPMTKISVNNSQVKPTNIISLSLAERKKRQWQKEKAELLQIYDPWGRPGAGAPLLDSKGNVITNYKAYNNQVNVMTSGLGANENGLQTKPLKSLEHEAETISANLGDSLKADHQITNLQERQPTESSASSSVLPVLPTELSAMTQATHQPSMVNQLHYADNNHNNTNKNAVRPVAVVPAAMRSSFLIGDSNNAPDYTSIREEEKRKWLMELEKQKEEQRLRKLQEKDKYSLPLDGLPLSQTASSTTHTSDALLSQKSPRHLRGHLNLNMDPVTQKQLEIKKQKNEELMLELKAQINERQKQKQLEWHRQQLEEAADELRLQEEKQLLNLQYQNELLLEKQKMEAKEQKFQKLAATIDQAREDALIDKKLKRLQYLERHGHDTTRLQMDLAATCQSLSSRMTNHPKCVSTLNSETSPYIEDELLLNDKEGQYDNQTLYQPRQRDFASQTDSYLLSKCVVSDNEIESEEEEEVVKKEKIVEEKNIPSIKPGAKRKKPIQIQDRPSWGYQNQNGKKPVRRYNSAAKQDWNKRVPNQQMVPLGFTSQKNFPPKLNTETNPSKDSKKYQRYNSESQKPRYGRQQDKVAPVQSGYNNSSLKSDTSRNHEIRVKDKVQVPRDPSPPVPTLRKKNTTLAKPPLGSVVDKSPRNLSPPVPAVRRKLYGTRQEIDKELDIQADPYNYDCIKSVPQQSKPLRKTSKYVDNLRSGSPLPPSNDFLPFTRTSDVLDPANADSPLPISREQSSVQRGRQSYWKGQQPADFGDSVEHFVDKPISDQGTRSMKALSLGDASLSEKKALFQELSALKQKLRELELETSTSMLEAHLSPR